MRLQLAFVVIIAAGCHESKPTAPAGPSTEVQPIQSATLHNMFRVSDRVYSGSVPEGDAAFAELARLGIKTIISVDGMRPDVEGARRHGLTYVHLPFGYDGIPRARMIELAKAANEVPGPIYVHCHHGQHRGPAAVAAIQLCNDRNWDSARAEAWLKTAGADPRYTGLYDVPRSFRRPTQEEMLQAPASFPAVAEIPDIARHMVEIDGRWDNLKLVQAAGWITPKEHPDVDPPHEAVQLIEHFREAARLPAAKKRGPEFVGKLSAAEGAAADLERALRSKPVDPEQAAKAFSKCGAACASCHDKYRNRPQVR